MCCPERPQAEGLRSWAFTDRRLGVGSGAVEGTVRSLARRAAQSPRPLCWTRFYGRVISHVADSTLLVL